MIWYRSRNLTTGPIDVFCSYRNRKRINIVFVYIVLWCTGVDEQSGDEIIPSASRPVSLANVRPSRAAYDADVLLNGRGEVKNNVKTDFLFTTDRLGSATGSINHFN